MDVITYPCWDQTTREVKIFNTWHEMLKQNHCFIITIVNWCKKYKYLPRGYKVNNRVDLNFNNTAQNGPWQARSFVIVARAIPPETRHRK